MDCVTIVDLPAGFTLYDPPPRPLPPASHDPVDTRMIVKSSTLWTPNPNQDLYICPIADRWYRIPHRWAVDAFTDCGRVHIDVDADFLFDGRSGGKAVDHVVPNLGTQAECKEWAKHDLFGHGLGLSFVETNDNLRMGLRDHCKYSRELAGIVHRAVSLSDDWFGEPAFDDKSYPNLAKIHVRHYPK